MEQGMAILLLSAIPVGIVHTLIGPDHYLPFIVLSKSRNWSMKKTVGITTLCGAGHVLSAVVLGVAAAAIGSLLKHLEIIESVRGDFAAWLLISFGFIYCVWGIRSGIRNKKHTHPHIHADGVPHIHPHRHTDEHLHLHEAEGKKELTPWILFIIFFFGPCEPLIPLVMYPAVQSSVINIVLVTLVFGLSTIVTMLGAVLAASFGLKRFLKFPFVERWGNAFSGGIICSCGLAMTFLGL